jgi:hypothetical protein
MHCTERWEIRSWRHKVLTKSGLVRPCYILAVVGHRFGLLHGLFLLLFVIFSRLWSLFFLADLREKVSGRNRFALETWKPKYMPLDLICTDDMRYDPHNGISPEHAHVAYQCLRKTPGQSSPSQHFPWIHWKMSDAGSVGQTNERDGDREAGDDKLCL